jgi:predicted TIM-barrel enzyme
VSRAKLRLKTEKSGSSVGIEVGEAAVHQVAAQLPFQIAEAQALQVLHSTAAQQTIRSHAGAPRASGTGATFGQTLADQIEQSGIVQKLIDGIQQIVLEQGGLLGQRGVEEPGLMRSGGDHVVLDYIE